MAPRRPARKKPHVPATPELRAAAHALLDRILDEVSGVSSVMVAVGTGKSVDAASEPPCIATKRGIAVNATS